MLLIKIIPFLTEQGIIEPFSVILPGPTDITLPWLTRATADSGNNTPLAFFVSYFFCINYKYI